MSAVSSYTSTRSPKSDLREWKPKNNCQVLLKDTIPVHWNYFNVSLATNGQDGNGLQLENVGPKCPSSAVVACKIAKPRKKVLWLALLANTIYYLPLGVLGATSSPGPSPHSKWRLGEPLAKAAKWLQKFVRILSRKTRWHVFVLFDHRSLIARKQKGLPDAGNNLRKSHFIMCHVTKYSTILGVFQQPWPGGFSEPPFWTRRRPWGRGWFWEQSVCERVYIILAQFLAKRQQKPRDIVQTKEMLRNTYLHCIH